jgi:hypothetical protein
MTEMSAGRGVVAEAELWLAVSSMRVYI